MKTTTVLLILLCSLPLFARNRVMFSVNPGTSFHNSENSMQTIGGERLGWSPGMALAFEREDMWGLDLLAEYSFNASRANNVIEYVVTDVGGNLQFTYGANLMLLIHNLDLGVSYRENEWLNFSIGPTISFVNRTIKINGIPSFEGPTATRDFEDRLASLCAGFNVAASVQLPIDDGQEYPFFFSTFKLRYLHSVWFDGRGRNLDNYYQSFLVGQVNIGLGYRF